MGSSGYLLLTTGPNVTESSYFERIFVGQGDEREGPYLVI
jgi:hypothetical protein